MKAQLKNEFERMIKGRLFAIALIVGCSIAFIQLVMEVYPASQSILKNYSGQFGNPKSLFTYFMGMNFASPYKEIFSTVLPILSMMPYALSYYIDIKSGYIKNVLSRTKRINYLTAKYVVTFIGGGITAVVPYILNLVCSICMLPALMPIQNGNFMGGGSLFWEVFYKFPLFYIAIYLVINFIFAGAFATIILAATFYIESIFLLGISSFIVWYGLRVISRIINIKGIEFTIDPIMLVDMAQTRNMNIEYYIAVLIPALLLSAFLFFYTGMKKDIL